MKRDDKNTEMIESSDTCDQKKKLDNMVSTECRTNMNDMRQQPRDMLYHDIVNRQREDPINKGRMMYSNSQNFYQEENGHEYDPREAYYRNGGYTREMMDKNGYSMRNDQPIRIESPPGKSGDNYYNHYGQNYQHLDKFMNTRKKYEISSGYNTKRKPKVRICSNCQTRSTPSWRRSGDGKKLLCNACGLYQKLHGRSRPFAVNSEGKTKAIKTNIERIMCMNCRTTETSYWRRSNEGHVLCNSCSLYLRDYVKMHPEDNRGYSDLDHKYDQDIQNNYMMQHHPNPSMRYPQERNLSNYSRDSYDFDRIRKQNYQKEYYDDYNYKLENTGRNRFNEHPDDLRVNSELKNRDSDSNEESKILSKKRSEDDEGC